MDLTEESHENTIPSSLLFFLMTSSASENNHAIGLSFREDNDTWLSIAKIDPSRAETCREHTLLIDNLRAESADSIFQMLMEQYDSSLRINDLKSKLDGKSIEYTEQGQYAVELLYRAYRWPSFIPLAPGDERDDGNHCFDNLTKREADALMDRLNGLEQLDGGELIDALEELGLDYDQALAAFGFSMVAGYA
jgi:hypothetical protein